MKKDEAIDLLGGTVGRAARAVGVTSQAISRWPPALSAPITDRVLAALARRYLGEPQLLAIARTARAAEDAKRNDKQLSLSIN